MNYENEYRRVLNEKHQLLGQIQVLSDALKETQRQLALARLANETLANRPNDSTPDGGTWYGEVD